MNNLSLARIMYGTSQESPVAISLNPAPLPFSATMARAESSHGESASTPSMLSTMLQKAWVALHRL